ncbi:MAG: hypothetical protein P4L22_03175 [Candidatus Babeliales bacterium]|nr:hypothetical protein [Candidatus Babeliales bacterium]
MKKIILVLLIFTFNVFAKQFTLINKTGLTIQPFLYPVKFTKLSQDGAQITKYKEIGYVQNGKIIEIKPNVGYTLMPSTEKGNTLIIDFSTASQFIAKGILTSFLGNEPFQYFIESQLKNIEDNGIYILFYNENNHKITISHNLLGLKIGDVTYQKLVNLEKECRKPLR